MLFSAGGRLTPTKSFSAKIYKIIDNNKYFFYYLDIFLLLMHIYE